MWVYRSYSDAWYPAFPVVEGADGSISYNRPVNASRMMRRAFHSCVAMEHEVVRCFGGAAPLPGREPPYPGANSYLLSELQETSDFFDFDPATRTITEIARRRPHDAWPAARVECTVGTVAGYTAVAGGGPLYTSRRPLSDMDVWLYSDDTRLWRPLQATGDIPAGRFAPQLISVGLRFQSPLHKVSPRLVLAGGCFSDDIYDCMPCSSATVAVTPEERARIYASNRECVELQKESPFGPDVGQATTPMHTTTAANHSGSRPAIPAGPPRAHVLLFNTSSFNDSAASGQPAPPITGEWALVDMDQPLVVSTRALLSREPCAVRSDKGTLYCILNNGQTSGDTMPQLASFAYLPEGFADATGPHGSIQVTISSASPLSAAVAIYGGGGLAVGHALLFHFGGFAGLNFLGSTDHYSLAGNVWSRMAKTAAEGIHRLRPAVGHFGRSAIVFGGISSENTVSGETWHVDLISAKWTRVMPAGLPGRRYGATLTVLPDGHMVCYGGMGDGWLGNGRPTLQGPSILHSGVHDTPYGYSSGETPWSVAALRPGQPEPPISYRSRLISL